MISRLIPSCLNVLQANGVQAYLTTLVLFFTMWKLNIYNPARVYDLFGEILAALNIFSLAFCLFLYIKAGHQAHQQCQCLQASSSCFPKGGQLCWRKFHPVKLWASAWQGMSWLCCLSEFVEDPHAGPLGAKQQRQREYRQPCL